MNNIGLLGRLARDPEMRYTEKGVAVTKFTIAVPRERDRDKVDFINCLSFGTTAEALASHCHKGRQLLVEGRLEINLKKDKVTDKTVSYTNVIAHKIEFLAKPKEAAL